MNHPWHDIEPGDPEEPVAFVEIPSGTKTKYELDKKTGLMRVDRVLFASFVYPFNYGFVPQTQAADGDPVDVFLMGPELLPMTLVGIRPIGMLRMQDEGSRDNKILAVPLNDPRFADVADSQAVASHHLRELEHFLAHYKDLERKQTVVTEWVGRTEAVREIRDGLRSYRTRRRASEPRAPGGSERSAS
jgi:inorganic pyrophosphatase